jgi:hypothetical protein
VTPRRVNLGDTVRVGDHEGVVTGTMTLGPNEAGGAIKRSVCVSMLGVPRTVFVPPSWYPIEDVVLVTRAAR